jgi:hypothetical protein
MLVNKHYLNVQILFVKGSATHSFQGIEYKFYFTTISFFISSKIVCMTNEKEYIPKSAMSIHAHPDDQEFSIGGTLAKWAKAGCEIISVTITSGDSGSNDVTKDGKYKPELAKLREAEQQAANDVLGIKHTVFMRYSDGDYSPHLPYEKN